MSSGHRELVRVLITPAGGPGVLPEVTSLLQSEKYLPYIVLADSDPAVASFFMPGIDAKYILPTCTSEDYIPALIRLIKKEKIEYHYSGLDEELPILEDHADQLRDIGCQSVRPSADSLRSALDKISMAGILSGKVLLPNTRQVSKTDDVEMLYRELGSKVIFKASSLRGGREISLASNLEEFKFYHSQCLRKSWTYGTSYLVQTYIEGDEYNVSTLHDLNHNEIFAVCRRKFEKRLIKSTTTAAVVERRDAVIEMARQAIKSMRLTPGFNNVEIIVSNFDNKPYLIEINGGRTAAQDMNLVASGFNLSDLMIDIIKGRSIQPIPHPPDGVVSLQLRSYLTPSFSDLLKIDRA